MATPRELRSRHRRVPAWWADAKLGIFVHWTPASVPAFAPTDADINELVLSGRPDALASAPYSEWYENSLRFPESPAARFHREHYGDRPYSEFAKDFVAGLAGWDPGEWAARFAATGARYVVLVTKHHDGFCLWPTRTPNPHRAGWHSDRDIVGELADAVRSRGMRFGVYYSGGLDWTFDAWPIGTPADTVAAAPRGNYVDYAEAQVRELIERYRPSVLWNDISWPAPQARLNRLLADYYHAVPDGVVNDRWMAQLPGSGAFRNDRVRSAFNWGAVRMMRRSGGLVPPAPRFWQHRTPEYTTFSEIQRWPWECVRGMDKGFAYNRMSVETDFIAFDDLAHSLIDITSKGGNLMINVGPRGQDAQIPEPQLARLERLSQLAPLTTAALQRTRPWVRARDRTPEGHEVRWTAVGDRVWALCWPADDTAETPATVTLPVRSTPATSVWTLHGATLGWQEVQGGLRIAAPATPTARLFAVALDSVDASPAG